MYHCPMCGKQLPDGVFCDCGAEKANIVPANKRPPIIIVPRDVLLYVVISIVTCGIFRIYWQYQILTDLDNLLEEQNNVAVEIILAIVTCGLYGIYLYYKMGCRMIRIRKKYNLNTKDDTAVFVMLALFGLGLISDAIIQTALNDEVEPGHVKSCIID